MSSTIYDIELAVMLRERTRLKCILSVFNLLALLVTSCLISLFPASGYADNDTGINGFEFALIGDMPYDGQQRKEFVQLMDEVDQAELVFVIHNGDFWFDGLAWKESTTGLPPCSNEVFSDRSELASLSAHPFILVPGDNDWTDCHRAKPVTYDPLERLEKFRQLYYPDDQSLGKRTLTLQRQSDDPRYAAYRENVRWVYGNVMFVTLHMVGGNNNLGRTAEMDEEFAMRNKANLAWLRQAFATARDNGHRGIMIIAHANPQFETTWSAKLQNRYLLKGLGLEPSEQKRPTGFDDFVSALEEETLSFGKPVVYVHGDTHTFRIDKPLVGSFSGRMIENFTRVETIGYRSTHWIRASVVPDDPNVFSFRQEIVDSNRVDH